MTIYLLRRRRGRRAARDPERVLVFATGVNVSKHSRCLAGGRFPVAPRRLRPRLRCGARYSCGKYGGGRVPEDIGEIHLCVLSMRMAFPQNGVARCPLVVARAMPPQASGRCARTSRRAAVRQSICIGALFATKGDAMALGVWFRQQTHDVSARDTVTAHTGTVIQSLR